MFDIRVIDFGEGLVVCSDELDIESSEVTENELWLDGGVPRQWSVSIESTGRTL